METRKLYVGDEAWLHTRPTMPAQTAWIVEIRGDDYLVRRSDGIREIVSNKEFTCLRALRGIRRMPTACEVGQAG